MRLVRLPEGAASGPVARPIGDGGASIGRSADCDLVLDDPLRLVSRRHAMLVPCGAGQAMLHCVSTSASLTVNGEALPPGGQCAVADGDRIGIGAFEILLEVQRPADAALMELARHVAPPPSAPAIAPPGPARSSRLDQWFALDAVADPLGPGSPLASLDTPSPLPPARPAAVAASAAVAAPLRAAEPAPPSTAAPPDGPPAGIEGDAAALRQAFLRGAGLADERMLGPAWAEHAGALLRSMTEGTFELLRSRAATKQSIRAQGTQIAARENNPLKFAPDARECLRLLLQERARPGFLAPLEALHDAHRDLQMHQLAMVAGMRAAVSELILRLGPTAIEEAAGAPRGWARILPWLREAELWRRQREHHARLLDNLDDAFEAAFGREFLLAYEAQARRTAPRPETHRDAELPAAESASRH